MYRSHLRSVSSFIGISQSRRNIFTTWQHIPETRHHEEIIKTKEIHFQESYGGNVPRFHISHDIKFNDVEKVVRKKILENPEQTLQALKSNYPEVSPNAEFCSLGNFLFSIFCEH